MGRHRLRHTTLTEDPTSEPDSVEQEFGNEYSEDTLNLLRGIERPPYLEETSSLDPVDDLDQYIEHGLSIPPATYDALQEIGQKDLENLQAAKDFKPDATTQDTIRYRQRLAQGASPQDMTWLKLRAYHRAMDELNADSKQGNAPTVADRMQAYEVPTDKVPADLLTMTPAQLAERQRLALIARSRAAKKAQQDRNAIQRILAMPEFSEESEWVAAQQQPNTMQQAALAGIMEAVREHQGSLQLLPPIQEREVSEEKKGEPEEQPAAAVVLPITQRPERRTVYTQSYLHQLEMQKKVQQQQRQRTAAFWLSFAAVSGAYILRHVRRALFKRKGPAKPPAKLQARPSDAGASGSGLRQRTSSGV